jgi:histidinol-phosphatase
VIERDDESPTGSALPAGAPRDLAADLQLALGIADEVDQLTMARFGAADLVVESKPDLTPVSEADLAAEELIRTRLKAARPGDTVSGEEFATTGTSRWRWVLDPIDGTKNYVRGVPVWATLIGLLDGDDAVLGVVSAPALGRRWWAHRGGGAFATVLGAPARRLHVSTVHDLADASLSIASLEGWSGAGRDRIIGLTDAVWRTRGYGDFWSYMLVAEGAVDLATEPELSLWDVAALAPVVTEAGGTFTGLNGRAGVQHGNAAASNTLLHQALLEFVGDRNES